MFTEYTYKEQGDGSPEFPLKDSWAVKEWSGTFAGDGDLLSAVMVFEDPEDPILIEKAKYDIRRRGGIDAYLLLMAEFRLAEQPRNVNQFLEDQLEVVRNEITNGQWITALEKLEEITPVPSGDLTQEIYDRLHLSITTYIDNNY